MSNFVNNVKNHASDGKKVFMHKKIHSGGFFFCRISVILYHLEKKYFGMLGEKNMPKIGVYILHTTFLVKEIVPNSVFDRAYYRHRRLFSGRLD